MFFQFKNVKTEVMFWNPNWLPVIRKLLPHAIEERLASCWGWHLWIYGQKHHLAFAERREIHAQNTTTPMFRKASLRCASTENGQRFAQCVDCVAPLL